MHNLYDILQKRSWGSYFYSVNIARTIKNSLLTHQVENYCHFVANAGSFDTAIKYCDQKLNKSQKRTWWSSLSFSDALEIFKRPSEGGPPCSILFFSKRSIHQEEVVGAHAWLKTNKVTVIRRPNLTWWASRLFFSVLVMLVVLIRFNLPLLSTQSIKSLIADIRLLWKEK